MIESAARVPRGTSVQADVCVVGAGAAGIPLALSLSGKGLSVVLLEGGAQRGDAQAHALYAGELARPGPHRPPDQGRLRGLGGTTQAWDGRCLALDPIDFERRAHVPHSGWPISREGLLPWYARAAGWLEVGRFASALAGDIGPLVDGLDERLVDATRRERLSCPTDLGRRYRDRLQAAEDVRVLTGAHVTAVRLHADGTRAQRLACATMAGYRFDVAAHAIVLATGGLEVPRLLLASDDVQPQGIGNAFDQVGRYYQCQLRGLVGTLAVRGQPPRGGYELAADGVPCRRRLSIAAAAQKAEGLLNASLWLEAPDGDEARAGNAQGGAAALLPQLGQAMRERLRHARRWPAWREGLQAHAVWVQAEQQPLPSSRVGLAADRDPLGVPRLRVDWRRGLADIASVRRTLSQLAVELARARAGTLTLDQHAIDGMLPVAGHHIGTARMGRDPRTSVVDPDCRVHGVQNLYVAGSAVFPTSGHADPTLTIVALALRLADHLVRRLQPRRAAALELFA